MHKLYGRNLSPWIKDNSRLGSRNSIYIYIYIKQYNEVLHTQTHNSCTFRAPVTSVDKPLNVSLR